MLDFNEPIKNTLETQLINLLDQALQQERDKQTPRQYLGASLLGESCLRKIQYQYFDVDKDENQGFTGQQLRIFDRGHQMEAMMVNYLRLAGFNIQIEKANGQPIGFSVAKGKIKGHVDGVIIEGPEGYQYPMLWECKALKASSWKDLKKKGLAVSKPIYAAQVAIYQTYCQLHEHPALFTALNADTMEIYVELVPFDGELAQRISDKAVRILQACEHQEKLPRMANDPSYYQCQWCAYQDRCWEERS